MVNPVRFCVRFRRMATQPRTNPEAARKGLTLIARCSTWRCILPGCCGTCRYGEMWIPHHSRHRLHFTCQGQPPFVLCMVGFHVHSPVTCGVCLALHCPTYVHRSKSSHFFTWYDVASSSAVLRFFLRRCTWTGTPPTSTGYTAGHTRPRARRSCPGSKNTQTKYVPYDHRYPLPLPFPEPWRAFA